MRLAACIGKLHRFRAWGTCAAAAAAYWESCSHAAFMAPSTKSSAKYQTMHILCLSFEIQKRAEQRMRLTAIIFGVLTVFFAACENEQLKLGILIYAPSSRSLAVPWVTATLFLARDYRYEHVQHVWQAALGLRLGLGLGLSSACLAAATLPFIA